MFTSLLWQFVGVAQHSEAEIKYQDTLISNPTYAKEIAANQLSISLKDSIKSEWLKKIGIAFYYARELDSAKLFYKKAILISEDPLFKSKCYSNIGVCYNEQNIQDSAIHYYTQAIEELSLSNDPFLANVHTNLTKLYLDLELAQKAIEHGKKSLEILSLNNLEESPAAGSVFLNLGSAYTKINEVDSSLKYNTLAKMTFAQNGYVQNEIAALVNMIKGHDLKGEQVVVKKLLEEMQQLLLGFPSEFYQMVYHQSKGTYFYKEEDLPQAKKNYTLALGLAEELNESIYIRDLSQNLSLVFEGLGNHSSALQMLQLYHHLKDSIQDVEVGLKIVAIEEAFQAKQKDEKILLLNKDLQLAEKNQELQGLKIADQQQRIANQNLTMLLFALLALIVIVGVLVWLKRRELKMTAKLLATENKRLRTERKLLQSQMNPHFIFNTLNSIQRFILEKDSKSATTYLGKFGKLLRKILDFTRSESVSLKEELDVLKSYLAFEKLRFNDKFDYAIHDYTGAADDLDVPPLILQPFAENAILHGFKEIDYEGKLTVEASVEDVFLFLTISDNGIGRKRAASNSDFDRKSHGIDITLERLKSEHPSNDLHYEDLLDDLKNPSGTKVTLKIHVS